jgi:hypothetical protein
MRKAKKSLVLNLKSERSCGKSISMLKKNIKTNLIKRE